ncbi:nuclear transport factor 2 family protein [Listeria monocytogenes]|uniref:nuclear transport factor 2 family protein n=1 Tax=Listeria monocytogenes TaxID=1639 RepID=UPI00083E2E6E|nr:nuclear transport factor 2 family protein [Listeria monocytogenes]ODF68323.1 bile acid 7-alpha dehydratase [Listeria monocytogenes]
MLLTRNEPFTAEKIQAKADILELVQFERFCRDNELWDAMETCFTKDSNVKISWFQGTGHGFIEASKKMTNPAPHKIYNTQVWIKNDRAVAIMQATIQTRTIINGVEMELNSDAKLVTRVERIDGKWYINAFEGVYEKDSLMPVVPSKNADVPAELLANFRKSYACLALSLTLNGYEIDNNLPGIDRPEQVTQFFKEADEWLLQ